MRAELLAAEHWAQPAELSPGLARNSSSPCSVPINESPFSSQPLTAAASGSFQPFVPHVAMGDGIQSPGTSRLPSCPGGPLGEAGTLVAHAASSVP